MNIIIKMKNKPKNIIIMCAFLLVSVLLILSSFFYLESRIYKVNYEHWPGDCGQFVIWMSALWYDKNVTIDQISLETNPFRLFTGPLTIKEELKKVGIETTFYNNFSIQEVKEKLDEKKPVIVMVNIDSTEAVDAGLTHYLFVFSYKEDNGSLQGFYFTDAYYFLGSFSSEENLNWSKPYYFTVQELEEKRHNVLGPGQFVGEIENAVGMEKFAIVVGEKAEDRGVNKRMLNAFYLQHYAEKLIYLKIYILKWINKLKF